MCLCLCSFSTHPDHRVLRERCDGDVIHTAEEYRGYSRCQRQTQPTANHETRGALCSAFLSWLELVSKAKHPRDLYVVLGSASVPADGGQEPTPACGGRTRRRLHQLPQSEVGHVRADDGESPGGDQRTGTVFT